MRRARVTLLLLSLITGQCGGDEPDLPPEWGGASSLPVDQSSCTPDEGRPGAGTLMLMREMGRLRATYREAPFRCQQRLCVYRLDEAGSARVLVQPCDMNPSAVAKCSCRYDVGFDVAGLESGRTVALYRRWDRYGATTEPAAEPVASARAP